MEEEEDMPTRFGRMRQQFFEERFKRMVDIVGEFKDATTVDFGLRISYFKNTKHGW